MAKLLDQEVSELELVIETLDTLYEIGEDCIHPVTGEKVSNAQYDVLRKRLFDLHPDSYIFKDVTASKVQHKNTITHNPPLTSISKAIGTLDERTDTLKSFIDSVKTGLNYSQSEEDFLVQAYKRDGVAVALYYENGKLVRAGIRPRDGVEGENLIENIKFVNGIPTELWEHDKEGNRVRFLNVSCSIRGEVECNKIVFKKIVENWENSKYELNEVPKNPRNFSAGSLRKVTNPEVTKHRQLNFVGYSILNWNADDNTSVPFKTEIERAKYSNQVLRIPFVQVRKFRWQDLQTLENFAPNLDYEVDGIVISVNNLEDAEQMGTHGNTPTGNPKAKIAWKFAEEEAIVEVRDIVWTPGRSGKLTPVLSFDGVVLDGTTVSQCTGHSLGFIDGSSKASLGVISKFTRIKIIKSGKIIPKVIEVLGKTFGFHTNPEVPKKCPSCQSVLEIRQGVDGKDLVCTSDYCGVVAVAKLIHFLSAIGVKGISNSILSRLVDEQLVKTPDQLYKLNPLILNSIGFSKRQALLIVSRLYLHNDPAHATDEQLEKFIEDNKKNLQLTVPAWQFFASFGIPGTGKSAGQALINHFGNFDAIRSASSEELSKVEGLGETSVASIVKFFQDNKNWIDNLLKIFVPEGKKQGKLSGKTFVFTGTFVGGKGTWEKKVLDHGASTSGSVGKTTTYVVVGTDAGSKEARAKELNIPILTPDQLDALISQ